MGEWRTTVVTAIEGCGVIMVIGGGVMGIMGGGVIMVIGGRMGDIDGAWAVEKAAK